MTKQRIGTILQWLSIIIALTMASIDNSVGLAVVGLIGLCLMLADRD